MLNFLKLYNKTSCSLFYSNTRHFSTAAKQNYYQLLGLNDTATQAEIKSAFHKKAKEYHPDVQNANSTKVKEAEEKFKQIVEAYKTLSDDIKRKDYDETIKPKPNQYSQQQQQQADTRWQEKYKNSGYTYTRATRNPNEKFYGDENTWEQENEYQPPPPPPHQKRKPSIFETMNYESMLIWGMVAAFMFRWYMLKLETDNSRPYSVEEKLDPFNEDEEGVFVEVRVPKDRTKPLSIRDCQGLTFEQLDELDNKGYTLPSSIKEQLMDWRDEHRLYKKKKESNIWNYNKQYNEKPPVPSDGLRVPVSEEEQIEEFQPRPRKPRRKPKTMREVADDVKKDIMGNDTSPPPPDTNLQASGDIKPATGGTENGPIKEEPAPAGNQAASGTGAGEVRIPRMKANMYHLEKRG